MNIKFIYPEILNFTSEDTLSITFITSFAGDRYFFLLNPNSSPLECENLNQMKICRIPASHFVKKKSGYFYLHYQNGKIIKEFYDLPPIKVILPNSLIEIPIEQKDIIIIYM